MDSGGLVVAKCLNLPAKCDSPVAECRSVSLKPQQELTLRHVPGCHGADWLDVKLALARHAGKGSFQMGCHIPLTIVSVFYMNTIFWQDKASFYVRFINKIDLVLYRDCFLSNRKLSCKKKYILGIHGSK